MSKKRVLRFFKFAVLTAVLVGAYFGVRLIWFRPVGINTFYTEAWYKLGGMNPEGVTEAGGPLVRTLSLPGQAGLEYLRELNDPRPEADVQRQELARKLQEQLQQYAPEQGEARDHQRVVSWVLEQVARSAEFSPGYELLAIPGGRLYQTPFGLCYSQPIGNPEQAQAYLLRLRVLGSLANIWEQQLKAYQQQGLLPPREVLLAAARFCERFSQTPVREHPLYRSFAQRAVRAGDLRINQNQAIEYLDRIGSLLEDSILPAWKSLGDSLTELAKGQPSSYSLSPEALNQGIAREGGRPLGGPEMDSLRRVLNQAARNLTMTREQALRAWRPEEPVSEVQASFQAALSPPPVARQGPWKDSLEMILDDLRIKAGGAFPRIPEFRKLIIDVQDTVMQALSLPVIFIPGDLEGERKPRLFFHPEFSGKTLATGREHLIQQAIPGCHLGLWYNRRNEARPRLRRAVRIPAWEQGWSLYASAAADEIGLNLDPNSAVPAPPYGRVLHLDLQLQAVLLALTDLERALVPNLKAEGLFSRFESMLSPVPPAIQAELLARPGAAVAAWQHYQALIRQRKTAALEAGAGFYLADFHQELLDRGPMPLVP